MVKIEKETAQIVPRFLATAGSLQFYLLPVHSWLRHLFLQVAVIATVAIGCNTTDLYQLVRG